MDLELLVFGLVLPPPLTLPSPPIHSTVRGAACLEAGLAPGSHMLRTGSDDVSAEHVLLLLVGRFAQLRTIVELSLSLAS